MFAKRAIAVKTSRLLASRKVSDAGILTFCGRSRPGGGRSRVRSISVCSSVLPSRGDGDRRAQLVARRAQFVVDVAARRVQLGRQLVLDERLVELAGRGEPAAALK